MQDAEAAADAACGALAEPSSSTLPASKEAERGASGEQRLQTDELLQRAQSPPCLAEHLCESTQLQDEVAPTQVVPSPQPVDCGPSDAMRPPEAQAACLAHARGLKKPAASVCDPGAPEAAGPQHSSAAAAEAEQALNGVRSHADAGTERDGTAAAAEQQHRDDTSPSSAPPEARPQRNGASEAAEARATSLHVGPAPASPDAAMALAEDGLSQPSPDEGNGSQQATTAASPAEACPAVASPQVCTAADQQPAPHRTVDSDRAAVEAQPEAPACGASGTVDPPPSLVYAEVLTAPLLGQATPAAAATGRAGCSMPGKLLTPSPVQRLPPASATPQPSPERAPAARLDSSAAAGERLSDAEVIELWRDTCENMDAGCERAAVRYRTLTLDVSCAAKAHGVRLLDDPQVRSSKRLLCILDSQSCASNAA